MCIFFNAMYICCTRSEKSSDDQAEMGNVRPAQNSQTGAPITVSPSVPRASLPRVVQPAPVHQNSNATSAPPDDWATYEDHWAEMSLENTPDTSPVAKYKYPKLEEYSSSEDLKQLTVKELKILLTLNRVDYRGCIEKHELLEKVQRLWEDNNQHKDIPENMPTEQLCKLCMDAPLDCVLLECGHIASCVDCGKKLAECPICRQFVVRVVRTFKA